MGTRQRARDVTRKSDINQIQKALEMYKFNQTPSKYPDTNPWIDALQDTAGGGANATMKTVPNDPLCPGGNCSGSAVVYSYERDASDNLKYTLIACLENASDQQKDAVKNAYCSAQAASLTRTEP
ncbi:MAG: type II secretion system protein GspG [bacterium]|nr:type II secretion system protein GspG [bacterium]